MGKQLPRVAISLLLVSSFLSGCASTSSDGSAALNQGNWPFCSLIGGLVGGGLGAIESSAWAAGGAAAGAIAGGLICYAQDGDADGDGVFDRRDNCPNTPSGLTVDSRGCPERTYPQAPVEAPPPQDEVIVLSDMGNVLFAFDSAELTSTAKEQLVAIANRLTGANLVSVKVVGHTDSTGADAYNQGLSERRAQSVADFLASEGVPAGKLTAEGMGESRPVADNGTDAGRAQNRRVEIHVDR
ncbi:OmpA family protein [Pseudomonas resinovorans]|uniref:OmpA family protein n=1 Tax=Metapseudomonas resinovorans TaxID=53412 RepID=UPI00237F21B6|nr:OmpA family protein [Pseudomonas resinovorans]MDE3737962.1 OmpA family protein [Pseudomonas resinovorans]